jgi:hypothetical protein
MFSILISRRVWVPAVLTVASLLCLMVYAQRPEKPVLIHYLASAKPVHLDRERIQTFVAKPGPPLSEEEATRLAERLSSYTKATLVRQKDPGEKLDSRLLFQNQKDPSATFDINLRTGEFLFNGGLAQYKKEEDTGRLPSSEEAARLASVHLEKLTMLPPQNELVLAHVGGVNMGLHRPDGSTSLYRKLVVVRYDRTLAGLPVLGDSRVVLRLAEGGSLAGLIRRWSPVEGRKVQPEELLADDVIEKSIKERLLAEGRTATSIVVKFTDLVLYDHGNGVIEPAIHVVADMHFEVPVMNGRSVGEIRRLDVPYDTFLPVLKNYKAKYPFMRNPEATKRVQSDQPVPLKERETPASETTAGEKSPD